MRETFVKKLEACEKNLLPMMAFEQQIVEDLRRNFDERETQLDLGMNPWNPSADQWNTLGIIYEAYAR
jgi:hypothetical protein